MKEKEKEKKNDEMYTQSSAVYSETKDRVYSARAICSLEDKRAAAIASYLRATRAVYI